MRRLIFIIIVFGFYVKAFAVSPYVIDFSDVKINEKKNSSFYIFNTRKENLSLILEYVGEDWISFDRKFIEFNGDKKFVNVELKVPSNAKEGNYKGNIYVKENPDKGNISLSKGYAIKVLFDVVDGFFVKNNTNSGTISNLSKVRPGFVSFTKPEIGKVVKISYLFKNDYEDDYFLMKGEVFVDDIFYDILHSDIVFLKKNEKKLVNVYFTPEISGKYDIHLKIIGEEYESEEQKISFVLDEKAFLDKFDSKSLFFVSLCGVVVLLALVNVILFLIRAKDNQ
jgi:hypothetical protein